MDITGTKYAYEIFITPIKGFFYIHNGVVGIINAMRTDISDEGQQVTYGVSVEDDIPDLGSQEYFDWVSERKLDTYNHLSMCIIGIMDVESWCNLNDCEATEYEQLSATVKKFEHFGIFVTQEVYDYLEKLKPQWSTPIRCVETGEEFKTVRDCSKHLKIPYMTIYNCVKNGNAHKKTGLHFEEIKEKG